MHINHKKRPDAKKVLRRVTDAWDKIMSRYSFELQNESDHPILREKTDWILQLKKTPYEAYVTHQVCLPQHWLARLTDGWLSANSNANYYADEHDIWNIDDDDKFGIPTAESLRRKSRCDPSNGARKHFIMVNTPNDRQTAVGKGSQAVALSDKPLFSPYSTSTVERDPFPGNNQIYVIPFNLPREYSMERELTTASAWECMLCFENGEQGDGGVYFGECGHYICGACCREPGFVHRLNAATACYGCRQPSRMQINGDHYFPPSQEQIAARAKCPAVLDATVAVKYDGPATCPVKWAIQLCRRKQDTDLREPFQIYEHTPLSETIPRRCLRYDVEVGYYYLVNIWNVRQKSDAAHVEICSLSYTDDAYETIQDEDDIIDVCYNEFFCTPYPLELTVGEDVNAWIIKDESQNEILSIEFVCTGAVNTQAHTQHVLDAGVELMLSQLKAVMMD